MKLPMPSSVRQEMAGRATNRIGVAHNTKRQVAKVKGAYSSSPNRMTVKFRPHIATIVSAASRWSGVNCPMLPRVFAFEA